jgi:hypothetical protein
MNACPPCQSARRTSPRSSAALAGTVHAAKRPCTPAGRLLAVLLISSTWLLAGGVGASGSLARSGPDLTATHRAQWQQLYDQAAAHYAQQQWLQAETLAR